MNSTSGLPDYNAAAGYNLATGLGTIDANVMVTNWGSVKLASTKTTMTATAASGSLSSIAHGTAVTISGTVTGNSPTGNVALMTDSTEPVNAGQAIFTLSNGSYTGSFSGLPGGTYNIWAQYGGDSANAMSTSAKTQITVASETSGTNLNIFDGANGATYVSGSSTAPGSTVDYGTQLVLEALVAPIGELSAAETCTTSCPVYGSPTGTVVFSDGGSTLNTAVLNAEGDAEFNEPFSVGSHTVTATYSGDNSYSKSASSAISFKVVQDVPTIYWSASITDNSGNVYTGVNQQTMITFYVENTVQYNSATSSAIYPVPVATPSGTVTVSSSVSGLSGTVTLSPGVDPSTGAMVGIGNFVVPTNVAANNNGYTVTISYSGDSNYTALAAQKGTIPILTTSGDGLQTSTIAATMSGSISPVSSITITGTVTGQSGHGAPTGGISIYSSGNFPTTVGFGTPSGVVSPFTITLNSQTLYPGSNFLTLQYFGDNTYNPSSLVLNAGSAVSNSLADFTLVPQTVLLPVAAGSSASDTINLTSVGLPAFSGSVA